VDWPNIVEYAQSISHVIAKRPSAMTPFLLLCVTSIPFLIAACIFRENDILCFVLVVVASLPVVLAVLVGAFFALFDRDRLHGEDYLLRSQALEITERKGGKIKFGDADLPGILNPFPEPKAIPQMPTERPPAIKGDGQ
jgi:hypothetical protein